MTTTLIVAQAVLVVAVLGTVLLTLRFGERVRVPRPPIGVFNGADVAVMSVLLSVLPFAYLALPRTAVGIVFGLVLLVAVQTGLTPLLGGGRATVAAVAAVGLTVALAWAGADIAAMIVGDAVVLFAVVAICALWAQSGMRAAHVAALAAVLTVYDLLATGLGSVTDEFITRVRGLPLAPLVSATLDDPMVAIGLGDCLLLSLWPLVARKAYGRTAGWAGVAIGVGLLALVHVGFSLEILHGPLPLLTILGPLIVAQYLYWRSRLGTERTAAVWLGAPADPPSAAADPADRVAALTSALQVAAGDHAPGTPDGPWLAIVDGVVVGAGSTAGAARRDARERGVTAVPTVLGRTRTTSAWRTS